MKYEIDWNKLLNETRLKYKKCGKSNMVQQEIEDDPDGILEHRNQFERDYDRVMSSSSLRRLQDKAQVFPLQESDFIRTRLTHSMEVSAIARSFGMWLEKWLSKKGEISQEDFGKIPAMLATAGLVHDIGNPPFGHYGEDVIKAWFTKYFEENDVDLETEQKSDFLNFDGNAQGLRVLTRLQFLNDQCGINFTYGTLSVLIKYPWDSADEIAKEKQKFGYFQQDKELIKDVIEETVGTRVRSTRNPLTYFLEASDDIAYLGADVEDGVKKGLIPWEKIFEDEIANEESEIYKAYTEDIKELKQKHDRAKQNQFPDFVLTSVQNFKVWAQGQMIREVKKEFIGNYDNIMNGVYGEEGLLNDNQKANLLNKFLFDLLVKYCFASREVLSLELAGDSVITGLLNVFVKECIMNDLDFEKNHKDKARKLMRMISNNFIFVHLLNDDYENPQMDKKVNDLDAYSRLLLITDFISGMTDSYAVDLHQKLKGVKIR
ncbi:dGTP triphosphohydrolase [Bacillus cereus group sp. MYBK14-1]|uniref:dGTP triphosphohydrolase n=1 Tax=Bacillus cereus group sp. MYBK14-1 TaxID=3450682 RepID=UPI003F7A4DCB